MATNRNNGTGGGQRRNSGASRRQSGGVPPLDAFENGPRRRPPNLPGQPGFDPGKGNPGGKTSQAGRQVAGQNSRGGASRQTGTKGKAGGKSSGKKGGQGTGSSKKRGGSSATRRPQKRISPARRRRRRFLAVFFTALVLIGAGIWFSLNVLFKIEGYTIEGDTGYTQEEIVQAFGFDIGENMFSFNGRNRAETMQQTLPYLENLRIKRKLPGTVVFQVTQAVETYCVEYNGGFAVLSESLKVLRLAESAPEGLTQLYGLSDISVQPGLPLALAVAEGDEYNPYQELPQPPATAVQEEEDTLETDPETGEGGEGEAVDGEGEAGEGENPDGTGDTPEGETPDETADPGEGETGEGEGEPAEGEEDGTGEEGEGENTEEEPPESAEPVRQELASPHERMEAMLELIALLEESELEDITWINVTDTLNLQFRWQGRITVVLGARSNLEEKLRVAIVMMTDREQSDIGENERGTIDVSTYTTTLKGYFTPE